MLTDMNLTGADLSILLCGTATMRRLNATFRQKDSPTDVLTFPQYEHGYDYGHATAGICDGSANGDFAAANPIGNSRQEEDDSRREQEANSNPLGDIAICLPVAADNAQQHGCSELEEVIDLTAHGMLHIVGFDHTHNGQMENDCMMMTQRLIYRRSRRRIAIGGQQT